MPKQSGHPSDTRIILFLVRWCFFLKASYSEYSGHEKEKEISRVVALIKLFMVSKSKKFNMFVKIIDV